MSGAVLRRWLGVHPESASVRLACDVLLGLSLFVLIGWGCRLLGASFSTYLVVVQVALFVLFGAFLFVRSISGDSGSASEAKRPRLLPTLLIAVVIGCFFYAVPPVFDPYGDGYDQVGYVRAIVDDDDLMPAGVLAPVLPSGSEWRSRPGSESGPESGADPRKGLFHPVMAAVSQLAGVDPVTVWRWSGVFLAPVAVLAFYAFARLLLPGFVYALVAVALFATFQAGVGPHFLATAGFGPHLAMVFLWLLFAMVVEYCRRPHGGTLVALCVLLVGGSLAHGVLVVHFGVMFVSLFVFCRLFSLDLRSLIKIAVASAACVVGGVVWKVGVSGPLEGGYGAYERLLFFSEIGDACFVPSPAAIAADNGLLFLAGLALIPGLLFIRRHRRFALMSLVLTLPPVLIALNPLVVPWIYTGDLGLANAILLNIPVWIIIALVVGALIGWARHGTLWQKLIGLVLLFLCVELMMPGVREWRSDVRAARTQRRAAATDQRSRNLVEFINAEVAPGSVVLSDRLTSYAISAWCNVKVVGLPRGLGGGIASDRVARAKAVGNVLSQYTTPMEAVGVFERYGVDYVILDGTPGARYHTGFGDWDSWALEIIKSKLGGMSEALKIVYERNGYVVYEVGDGLPDRFSWFPNLPFSEPPPVLLGACETRVEAGAPRVTGVAVFPEEALAGEEIELSIRYRRDSEPPSELPIILRVRLEKVDYFSSQRSYPGDRYVRLIGERGGGRVRHDILHMPFGGFFTPEMWPIGRELYETVPIRLPRDLREGTYALRFEIGYGNGSSNVTMRDLLYNEDSYDGTRCVDVRVRHFLTR